MPPKDNILIKEGKYGYCPACGSGKLWRSGFNTIQTKIPRRAQRYLCQDCRRFTINPVWPKVRGG